MPVMDEFREEREALKHGTPKQKFQYFLDYYKWHVIITVLIIGFAVSFIYQTVTRKDVAFAVSLVNAFEMTSGEEHMAAFAGYADINTDEYDVFVDSTLHIDNENMTQETIASSQKLMVLVAAGEVDVLMSDEAIIDQYAYSDTFYDLREVLTPQQLEQYEPYFYYMDQTVADAISEAQLDPDYDYSTMPAHPDPKKPEDMDRYRADL